MSHRLLRKPDDQGNSTAYDITERACDQESKERTLLARRESRRRRAGRLARVIALAQDRFAGRIGRRRG